MTEVRICDEQEHPYLECASAVRPEDLIGLVERCIENGCLGVLIEAQHLPAEFFDLRTRQAGEMLQKLQNYRLQLALVLPAEQAEQERFGEMVRESNRGSHFRVFATRGEAGAWLGGS